MALPTRTSPPAPAAPHAHAAGRSPQLPLASAGAPQQSQQTALAVLPQAGPVATAPAQPSRQLAPVAQAFEGLDLALPEQLGQLGEFGLLNVGGALEELGSRLPILGIEYLNKKSAQEAGLTKGLWTLRNTLQQSEAFTVILVAAKLQRVHRPKFDPRLDEQEPPHCYSADGQMPCAGDTMQPGPCARCALNQWGRDKRGKRTPPECTAHQVVLVLVRDPEDQLAVSPAMMVIKRTGLSGYRTAMDTIRGRAMQWGRTFPQAHRHLSVQCVLGAQEQQNAGTTYYVPTFGQFSSVEPEEAAALLPMIQAIIPAFLDADLLQLEDEPEPEATTATPVGYTATTAGYAAAPAQAGDASFEPGAYEAGRQPTAAQTYGPNGTVGRAGDEFR